MQCQHNRSLLFAQTTVCVYLTGGLPCGNSGTWFSFHFAALPSPGPQNTLLGGMLDIQLTEIDRQRQEDRHRERQRQRETERETCMGGPYGSALEVLSFTSDHIPLGGSQLRRQLPLKSWLSAHSS